MLETQFPETAETQPELLAHHYTEAGLSAKPVVYWQRAGQHAVEHSAAVEAISHLSQGIGGAEDAAGYSCASTKSYTCRLRLARP